MYWITRDKQKLLTTEMELNHIVNCLKMRLRQFQKLRCQINDEIHNFVDDFGLDGDMATAISLCREESEQLDKYEADIEMFVNELKRRGYIVTNDGMIQISLAQ